MSEIHDLLRFLGSRYERARSEQDEVRVRALELVVAACINESRDLPVEKPLGPPPSDERADLRETSELSEAIRSFQRDVMVPFIEDRPEPEPAHEPKPAPEAPPPPETKQEPAADGSSWDDASPEEQARPPEDPVRGAWEPPKG